MTYRKTMLSASIVAALMFTGAALAQETPSTSGPQSAQQNTSQQTTTDQDDQTTKGQKKAKQLSTVVVVGISASLEKSLQTKRNANAIVSAITAEGISKFPNTNAAEALSLLPGVQVDRQFGQGQRLTIDGIDSTLNLTLLDGHPVSQTSWRYFSQPQRGFNYLMISPEIIGRAEIFKSQQARLPIGSIGGTVIMHTRKPLDLKANTFSGSVGVNFNDQASKSEPTASLFYSWKNQGSTFGFDVGLQHYQEKIDRQGLEIFGWSPVSVFTGAGNAYVQGQVDSGHLLQGDMVPQEVNSAWFQQWLKRDSAIANVQFQPTENFGGNLSLLYIKERFTNYNQSVYNFMTHDPVAENSVTSFTRNGNGIITGGAVNPPADSMENIFFDPLARVSNITTKGADLTLNYHTDSWAVDGRIGTNKADNPKNRQYGPEFAYTGPYSWSIKGGIAPDNKADWVDPTSWINNGKPSTNIFESSQKDNYGELNFHKYFDSFINTIAVGARYFESKTAFRGRQRVPTLPDGVTMADYGIADISGILNKFPGIGFGAAHHPYPSKDQIIDFATGLPVPNLTPLGNQPGFVSTYSWGFDQKTTAAYVQFDYAGDALRGNVGVRWVHAKNDGSGFEVPTGSTVTFANLDSFRVSKTGNDNELLPSFTVIYDNGGDVVLRGSMAKVMAWAPYNAMSYTVAVNDTTLTGTVGNPGLGPYIAYNTDVSAEWYFAPQSVLAVSGFYKNIPNYIQQKTVSRRLLNLLSQTDPDTYKKTLLGTHGCTADGFCDFSVKQFQGGSSAKVKGMSLAYQQAFNSGFGLVANVTYANGQTSSGTDMPFLSKWSGSVSPYFEKGPFTARLNLNVRTKYSGLGYVAGAATPITDDFTTVSASIGWKFNQHWSLSLDGSNLTNTKYRQYQVADGRELLLNRYYTGRRLSARVHFTF